MAGPWEKYAQPAAPPAEGPWTKYAQPGQAVAPTAPEPYVQPAPPPGVISHGPIASYAANDPFTFTTRMSKAGNDPETDMRLRALDVRARTDGAAGGVARAIAPVVQGSTFGFGDELISAIYGAEQGVRGNDPVDAFHLAQEFQRQELAKQRDNSPTASLVSEAVGGVGTGVGLAMKGLSSAGAMDALAGTSFGQKIGAGSYLSRLFGSAAEGAAYGGAYGFGGADGSVADRAGQAKSNALLGAGVGAAAPLAVSGLNGAGSLIRNGYTALKNPELRAKELLAKGMTRDMQTPDALAQAVEAAAGAGQGEYRALDAAGRNTQQLAALAARTPGPARETMYETLAQRQRGQGERIIDHLEQAVGPSNAFATEEALINSRKANAEQAYNAAYAAQPPQGEFYDQAMQMPIVQKAIENMRAAASNSLTGMKNPVNMADMVVGGAPGTVGDGAAPQGLSTRGWDYVKRYLDSTVDALYNGSSEDKALAPVYKDLRDAIKSRLGQDNPDYGRALQEFSDSKAATDAIQTGRDLSKASNADAVTAAFGGLDPGQQDLARRGFARETQVKLERRTSGQDKSREFDTPAMQSKLDTIIADPTARAAFSERIAREQHMVRGGRAVTSGSDTYQKLADGADVGNTGGALAALLSGHPLRAAGLIGGQLLGRATQISNGMNEATAQNVAKALMSNDPAEIRALQQFFEAQQAAAAAPATAASGVNAGFNANRGGENSKKAPR